MDVALLALARPSGTDMVAASSFRANLIVRGPVIRCGMTIKIFGRVAAKSAALNIGAMDA